MAEEKNINEETSTSEPDVKLVVDACSSINPMICGHIIGLDDNKATLQLKITPELIADPEGLAHGGFIYSAGAYVAQAAINKKNTSIIGSKTSFFAPAKVGDVLTYEATARFDNSKKREVQVSAQIRDILVFEATYQVLVTEEHILKMQKSELAKYQNKKRNAESE